MAAIGTRSRAPRCAMDGLLLPSATHVKFEMERGVVRQFCSLKCAELWLAKSSERPITIRVVDERSGKLIDAAEAHFVTSRVEIPAESGELRHVFAREADADSHARSYLGRRLTGADAPFARYRLRKIAARTPSSEGTAERTNATN
jgi:hypothetical protein